MIDAINYFYEVEYDVFRVLVKALLISFVIIVGICIANICLNKNKSDKPRSFENTFIRVAVPYTIVSMLFCLFLFVNIWRA